MSFFTCPFGYKEEMSHNVRIYAPFGHIIDNAFQVHVFFSIQVTGHLRFSPLMTNTFRLTLFPFNTWTRGINDFNGSWVETVLSELTCELCPWASFPWFASWFFLPTLAKWIALRNVETGSLTAKWKLWWHTSYKFERFISIHVSFSCTTDAYSSLGRPDINNKVQNVASSATSEGCC